MYHANTLLCNETKEEEMKNISETNYDFSNQVRFSLQFSLSMLMIIVNAFVFFVSYFDEQESRMPRCTVHFVSSNSK